MPTLSSLQDPKLDSLLHKLRLRWEIGTYAAKVLQGFSDLLPCEDEILTMELVLQADTLIDYEVSPAHALYFGLKDNFWEGNHSRATVICCHAPIKGHVIVYDSYAETGLQGSLQALELSALDRLANSVFAKVTARRLFS